MTDHKETPPVDATRLGSSELVGLGKAGAKRGRLSNYSLRVSLLEQCSLNCAYCLPGSIVSPTAKSRWMNAEQYRDLFSLFAVRGVSKIRFTGGEPLLRNDVASIVSVAREVLGAEGDVALTTNGLALSNTMGVLAEAGLNRVTLHIDTLRADRYGALMGKGDPREILEVSKLATGLFDEVKWNAVVQRGKNDDELDALLAAAGELGIQLRFIELMNTGSAREYVDEVFISGAEIIDKVGQSQGGVEAIERRHPSDPAALYRTAAGQVFGLIASDTQAFCAACDRLRLTADGRLRGCLYEAGGVPLGAALKAGARTETLEALIDAGLDQKRSFHPLSTPNREPFSMADVGG